MSGAEELRERLGTAMAGAPSATAAADRLCTACVQPLGIDGASISFVHAGDNRGTFGSSGPLSRRLDELQFTFGEGPCPDAVSSGRPVLAADLNDPAEQRWPAFTGALLEAGIRAVFAFPIGVSPATIGVLDLFRHETGALTGPGLAGGLLTAELAMRPLLDLMIQHVGPTVPATAEDGWQQLAALGRVEIHQATGMITGALNVDPAEALVRLRAYAFAHGMTATEVGCAIVERRLSLDTEHWRRAGGPTGQTR